MRNTYCVSTATIVTLARLSVKLHVLCLSCLFSCKSYRFYWFRKYNVKATGHYVTLEDNRQNKGGHNYPARHCTVLRAVGLTAWECLYCVLGLAQVALPSASKWKCSTYHLMHFWAVQVHVAWSGLVWARGELSYLAPLGSQKISAPYFKQCFFRVGYYPPDWVKHHASQSQDRNNKYFILYLEFCINNKI